MTLDMDLVVIRDLYLVFDDLTAQIDYYIVTPWIDFVVECKNLYGNIEIDDKGNLVYNAPSQGIIDTLNKNRKLISNLTRKYGVKGIRFELASTSSGS